MKHIRTLLLASFFIVLLSSLFIANVIASSEKTLTVSPLDKHILWWVLDGDEAISGSISITHSIKFWITDPDGYILKDYGKITESTSFEISATKSGNYTLHFQSLSLDSTVVKVSYDVVAPTMAPLTPGFTIRSDNYSVLIQACVILIICIVIVVASMFVGARLWKRKKGVANWLPPSP